MKIKELFSDQSKWTTGACARDANGHPISSFLNEACCWCFFGGMIKCYPGAENLKEISQRVSHKLGGRSIIAWNDSSERTFEQIQSLAIELDI